jgi:type I restriction enzyme M protein
MSLPGGVFQPYSGVKTSVIFFRSGGHTDRVLFLNIDNDGYKLDSNHDTVIPEDDIPGAINVFKNIKDSYKLWAARKLGVTWENNWWFAELSEIKKHNFNLSAKQYKPSSTKNSSSLEDPAKLLRDIKELELSILSQVEELIKLSEKS